MAGMYPSVVVLPVPSRLKVALNGEAGKVSVSTEATAITSLPLEPELPKNVPAVPEFPALMVTITPSSTSLEATTAQAPSDQPLVPPILDVMMSTYRIVSNTMLFKSTD